MKSILFSTNSFDTIDNGPALFANIMYNEMLAYENFECRYLTEDVRNNNPRANIYKLNLSQTIWNKFFYQFFRVFKYHNKAKTILKTYNYNILVYNNAFTGVLSTLNFKVPVAVMINDYNRIDFLKRKRVTLKKSYFKNLMLFYMEKIAAKNASVVIVNSNFLKETVHTMYDVSKDKIKVLYKGIDINAYNFRLREGFGNTIEILFVKGGFENGGLYDLVKAIKKISNYKIKLNVIGPREIDLPKIKAYLLENEIEFDLLGPTHPDDVKKYFNKADIFCVPSYKEALGVANMEALASGVPVIATNVGGIPEVLGYGSCGWLVNPGNTDEIAAAIKECIQTPQLRIEKSNAGLAHVQKFNSKDLIKNFLSILNQRTA